MPISRFTVPAPDKFVNPATDTDPASVQRWIASLPYADLISVTRSVLRALTLLNRHPEKIAARAELMAAYRVPCARLLRVIPGRPNTPSSQEMRQLMTEMAYGYKHLINDTLYQRSWLKHRNRLIHGIYFSAKYLSLELFLAYEAYECTVANSWRELLSIYRLADQQGLVHEPADDRDQAEPANATISHVLKRILLLKLLDPGHMVLGEARACFDYFNNWASKARLENLRETHNPAGRFLVDLSGIEAPGPPDPDKQPQNPERYRYFNLIPVSRQVNRQMQRMELNGDPPPVGLQRMCELSPILVLKRMLLAWHGRQERRSNRVESFGWMLCNCGLSAVSHFLRQRNAESGGSKEMPSREEGTNEEVDLSQIPAHNGQQFHYTRSRCRQVNRSVSGICIRLQLPEESDPKVGQVLLLEEDIANQPGGTYAGIVRRCLRIDADTLEIGIQFIRGFTHAISVQARDDVRSNGSFHPGLWVDREQSQLSSILVPRGLYRQGREFIVEGDRPAGVIQAEQLVETTPNFERFRFVTKQP